MQHTFTRTIEGFSSLPYAERLLSRDVFFRQYFKFEFWISKFKLCDIIERVFNCVPHSHYARQRESTYALCTSTSVTALRPAAILVGVWCRIDVICENSILNVIQHHHLRHQKVGRRTGQSCSTVACYFLLRDTEFKPA